MQEVRVSKKNDKHRSVGVRLEKWIYDLVIKRSEKNRRSINSEINYLLEIALKAEAEIEKL